MAVSESPRVDSTNAFRPSSGTVRSIAGRPLVPAAVCLAAGIVARDWWIAIPLAVAILLAGRLLRTYVPAGMAIAALGFFALGWSRQALSAGPGPSDISRSIGQGYIVMRGVVISDPEPSTFSTTFFVRAEELASPSITAPVVGLAQVRIPVESGLFEFGEGIELRGTLQRPEAARNPGVFHHPDYLARLGVYTYVNIRRPSAIRRIPRPPTLADRLARGSQTARQSLIHALNRVLPPLEANLLAGIVLGQRTQLPAEIKDDFSATSATHILAASGMNVGILAAAVFWLGRALKLRRGAAAWLAILLMLVYTLMVGAKPSILRADIMATAFLLAALFNREPDTPSAISLAVLVLLLWQPSNLYDPGFQLSFGVVAALVSAAPLLAPILPRPGRESTRIAFWIARLKAYFVGGILLSIVAQLAAIPLIAHHFHQLAIVGILANALILLAVPVLFCGGFILWGAVMLSEALGTVIAWPLSVILAYVLGVARSLGANPWSVLSFPQPGWLLVTLYYAAFIALILWLRRKQQDRAESPA